MSTHEFVETAIWSDPPFEALTPHAKLVYFWSWTNPRCNLPGIYKATVRQIILETGLRKVAVERVLAELEEAKLVFYDGTYVFVRARVKYLHSKSPNTAKGIRRELQKLNPEHAYVQGFLWLYARDGWIYLREILGDFSTPASDPLRCAA